MMNRSSEMLKTLERFRKASRAFIPSLGVSPRILMLLSTIESVGGGEPVMVSKLSDVLKVTPAAITHMVGIMEHKGLVHRVPSRSDRRVINLSLTEDGKSLLIRFHSLLAEKINGLTEYLGEENTAQLVRLLVLMCNYFESNETETAEDEKDL